MINLRKKVSTFNNTQSTLLDSYVLLDLYSNRDGFQFVFNHVNVHVLAHALPTRISPRIASPIVTFLSSLSNSTSGVLTTSVVEYEVLIVLPPSIYIGPKSKYNSELIAIYMALLPMWRREM